jgi:pyruvate-ferredoxin/flavodoxin oxidoreductase
MAQMACIDGNEAVARVAFRTNEVCAIYPITPSSNMGEWADQWSAEGKRNIWGQIPLVRELQSEGGASGAVHGSLQAGALTSTFTASQGLLLMLPNMYKIAGELTCTVFHVSARSLAAQALSIFGDHSDVMSARMTGFAMLSSCSVQEAQDFAMISQMATLKSRVPFLHYFDGFRTSHEVSKIELLSDEHIRQLTDDELVIAHRQRALNPEKPVVRGTAQNPDVYFQGRETVNSFYAAVPGIVQDCMDEFAKATGRQYNVFEYYGAADAEQVSVLMGSGAETAKEAIDAMNAAGGKVGMIMVRLYRPWDGELFMKSVPASCKTLSVLDRCKEPGSAGEPLYQDVITALMEQSDRHIKVLGGRYGLSSKEFTPGMMKAVYDNATGAGKNHFTVGIIDDVSGSSLDVEEYITEGDDVVRAMFFGLGSDGTVGANKNSIKIIGDETENYAQGYFVYDSKKSGSRTISHLRFGPKPIRSTYLIQSANFIACHQTVFIEQVDMLKFATKGAVFLYNTSVPADQVWSTLPKGVQETILAKQLKFYVIDAYQVAQDNGMGNRINTVMQTCFFAISGVLPKDEAIDKIKKAIEKTYGKKGPEIVQKNFAAVDASIANLHQVSVPSKVDSTHVMPPVVSDQAPQFVKDVTAVLMVDNGNDLPVSKMPVDGTFPTGTTKWEKRNVAQFVPEWDEHVCIQCGNCSVVCPHQVIRCKEYASADSASKPASFKEAGLVGKNVDADQRYTLQIYAEDCTGCGLCVEACPAKDKENAGRKAINMVHHDLGKLPEIRENIAFFEQLPWNDRNAVKSDTVKGQQLLEPLFEFSGACAGCGETPYVGLVSKLFGDRMLVANATGCSSIYGGNLPTTPWAFNADGRGPSWSNSLFEDNAEFGMGLRLAVDTQTQIARDLCQELSQIIGDDLVKAVLAADQSDEAGIEAQRTRVAQIKTKLDAANGDQKVAMLKSVVENLVKRSVWIMGGDGWAYDIGYGGLDHVLASGDNVNVLVMDTEVYSNTGGQASKATPMGAVAKFASGGKPAGKKDLAMMAMAYGNVYVAKIAMGGNARQTLKALAEAESYDGPSLIIAYSHCIAHGINMVKGMDQQKMAVESGHWPLFRFDPRLSDDGKNPFQLDSRKPKIALRDYAYSEIRYKMLTRSNPDTAEKLMVQAQKEVDAKWAQLEAMAKA